MVTYCCVIFTLSISLVPDTRFVAFAFSGWWKIQTIQILLPRSAVGRRKRKTRTETGEKINIRAGKVLTTNRRPDSFLFPLSAARRVPPRLPDERRRNQKRRKRSGMPALDSYVSWNCFTLTITD